MTILTLCTDYLPNIGGISNHIYYLNKYLLQKGVNAKILHVIENSKTKHLLLEKDHNILDNEVYKFYIKDNLSKLNKIKYKRILDKIIKKNFPDTNIIHTHEFKTTEYLVPDGYKWVWTNHTSQFFRFFEQKNLKDKILFSFVKNKFKKADAIIAVSKLYQKKSIDALGMDINFIPNGVELQEAFKSNNIFKFPKDKIIILISARWSKVKGVHIILDLMENLKKSIGMDNLYFVFAGSGIYDDKMYQQNLLDRVQSFDNVKLYDVVSYNQMGQLYASVDIVIIPSLFESASIVTLEAMIAKKIVIASNIGGLPELIEDNKRGFLFEKENIEDLKKKLFFVIKEFNSTELKNIKEKAYHFTIDSYEWSTVAQKTIEVYKKVLQ